MRVGDLIGSRKEVYTVSEETSVHEVAQYLRAKEVRTVGVLGAHGKLTGVISQSDISDKSGCGKQMPRLDESRGYHDARTGYGHSGEDAR